MNNEYVLQLEDLPTELLVEIFRYMSARELYTSFSRLNIRLDMILKRSYDLPLTTAIHWDPVLFFFDSFRAIRIYFSDFTSSTLAQFNFSNFTGVRSFSIFQMTYSSKYVEPIEQIEKFLRPDLCPQLRSLQLPYCSQTLADWIFSGAFPYLKICHLYAMAYQKLLLPLSTIHTLPALRQLTIRLERKDALKKILFLCRNLTYLDLSFDNTLSPFVCINTTYSSLKHLRLSELHKFDFPDGQFDLLLSLFPNLTHFYLIVRHYHSSIAMINFIQIAQCLQHYLPRLSVLDLQIYNTRRVNRYLSCTPENFSQIHPLFKFFQTKNRLLRIASFDFIS